MGVRLIMSTAYHPRQMDSQKYHSNWEECIPSVLYAYHNTVHSATGFTPHQLLFGWTPICVDTDLRVPFVAAKLNKSNISSNVDGWLELRRQQLQRANVHMEYARAAMLKLSLIHI